MLNAEKIKEFAKQTGADLIGIANIERFKDIPAQHNPASIFPEAKSIIVIGRRITRGSLRGVEEGTQFQLYSIYGYDWLENRFLAMITFKVAEFLEDNRSEAVPLPNLPPQIPPMGIATRDNQPKPNVMLDFDDAAVRAGLGEIGFCGVLLTPEFGPRQRFQMILTDAELEPNPILKEKICDKCMECVKHCPTDAFRKEVKKINRIEIGMVGIGRGKQFFPRMNAIRFWLDIQSYYRVPSVFIEKLEKAMQIISDFDCNAMPTLFNRWHTVDGVHDWGGIYGIHRSRWFIETLS
ncbi:Epoxyqueuosine reductase [subsurface metagenome]